MFGKCLRKRQRCSLNIFLKKIYSERWHGNMRFINIKYAKAGMIVGKSIYNEKGKILVNHKVPLTTSLIRRMNEKGLPGFYIQDELSKDITINELISEELQLEALRVCKEIDIDAALDVAKRITEELSGSGEININLVSLRTNSDYTYKHSVHVAILSTLIGMGLGLNKSTLEELTAAGLLHDIGKMNVSPDILDKPGALTTEEYELVQTHAEYGYEKLKEDIMISSKTKMGVYSHHENVNGTGYPLGLVGDQIYIFAKIIHIADVYDALISKRSYKEANSPIEAIDFLQKNAGTMFEEEYIKVFLSYIPLYPKGRNVVLSTGEVAIVVENREHHTRHPIVRLLDGTTIDLSLEENAEIIITGFED